MFERRGTVSSAGEAVALTDPSPEPLTNVAEQWSLVLEPTHPLSTTTGEVRARADMLPRSAGGVPTAH